jgi:hypothetical protein
MDPVGEFLAAADEPDPGQGGGFSGMGTFVFRTREFADSISYGTENRRMLQERQGAR